MVSGPQTGSEGSLIEEARSAGHPTDHLARPGAAGQPCPRRRALQALTRHMRQGNYAIVHTHSSKAGILARLAALHAGRALPIIVHTVHGWSFHDYMPAATRLVYILLERWMARFTDALIVVAEKDIEKGLQAGIGQTRSVSPDPQRHPAGGV